MFIKRLSSLLGAALLTIHVFCQNTLTIHQKDGQQFNFGFDDKPVITYTDTDLVLITTKAEVHYPLASLSKFTFTDVEDAVNSIRQDVNLVQLDLDNYMVSITGAKACVNVAVIDPSGKLIVNYKTDTEGSVTFSIADLPEGIYIINSENLTCKILKK